jgi:hypothetical protein
MNLIMDENNVVEVTAEEVVVTDAELVGEPEAEVATEGVEEVPVEAVEATEAVVEVTTNDEVPSVLQVGL